jgi:hypothetical protein
MQMQLQVHLEGEGRPFAKLFVFILLPEVEGSGAFNCVTERKRNVASKTWP